MAPDIYGLYACFAYSHKNCSPMLLNSFVLLFFPYFARGLNCYVCNSSVDPGCLDSGFQAHIINSDVQPLPCNVRDSQFCIKTTTIYGAIMGTTRFCSSKSLGDQCQYVDFPDHDRIYQACVFTCEEDACNASSSRFQDLYVCSMFFIIMVTLLDAELLRL
ncbi:expressed protein [Echinococcus multilocularis]|uniref:Expressed protein n=1 Tax=Echinococcus multilocularis TaxID=6211 RepID=A0A068Y7F1_ECHMU|nr:expressed protein [Echinococcus multilocularis]